MKNKKIAKVKIGRYRDFKTCLYPFHDLDLNLWSSIIKSSLPWWFDQGNISWKLEWNSFCIKWITNEPPKPNFGPHSPNMAIFFKVLLGTYTLPYTVSKCFCVVPGSHSTYPTSFIDIGQVAFVQCTNKRINKVNI